MQAFLDFLSFKTFISLDVLIIMYYLGAIGVPVGMWLLGRWLKDKFCTTQEKAESKGKLQTKLIFIFAAIFIIMEVFWRVVFEFLIAYFQMRNVLVGM